MSTTITFKAPFTFEGKEFKSIELDLDSLKGRDITDTQRQYTAEGNFSAVPATDPEFCKRIAAVAASQPIEFFEELPAPDFVKVTTSVQNFLLVQV